MQAWEEEVAGWLGRKKKLLWRRRSFNVEAAMEIWRSCRLGRKKDLEEQAGEEEERKRRPGRERAEAEGKGREIGDGGTVGPT
jgi:hypothetical protein